MNAFANSALPPFSDKQKFIINFEVAGWLTESMIHVLCTTANKIVENVKH
jgi:hypothetical protein